MEKANQEEKKSIKMKEKEEKKALKLNKKEEKKSAKLEKKQKIKSDQKNKTKKKLEKSEIFKKIMAAFLIAFTLIGTCYTFIYLVVNG